jgi:hypothetical protein
MELHAWIHYFWGWGRKKRVVFPPPPARACIFLTVRSAPSFVRPDPPQKLVPKSAPRLTTFVPREGKPGKFVVIAEGDASTREALFPVGPTADIGFFSLLPQVPTAQTSFVLTSSTMESRSLLALDPFFPGASQEQEWRMGERNRAASFVLKRCYRFNPSSPSL